jgi:uncharacterized integral membrane protein
MSANQQSTPREPLGLPDQPGDLGDRVPPQTPAPSPEPESESAPSPAPASSALPQHKIQRTRVSGLWVATGCFAVLLLLLLIFILQNGDRVKINIFGANPTLPLGVALLLAAVLGALLVALIGAARVVQLRHTARRIARKAR